MAVVLFFATRAVAAEGPARSPSQLARARALTESAGRHYDLNQYNEALAEFLEAYQLAQVPALLFNIGQSYRQLRQYKQAYVFLQSYLKETGDEARVAPLLKLMADQDQGNRTLIEPEGSPGTKFNDHVRTAIAEIELGNDFRKNDPREHYPKAISELKAAYNAKNEPLLLFALGILHFKLMEPRSAADMERRFMLRYVEGPGVMPKERVSALVQAMTDLSAWEDSLPALKKQWLGWQPADTLAANKELVARCQKSVPLSREPDPRLLKTAQEQDSLPRIPEADGTEWPSFSIQSDRSWSAAFKASDPLHELEAAYKKTGDPRILWHAGGASGNVADRWGDAAFNEKRDCYKAYYLSFVPGSGFRRDVLKYEESMELLSLAALAIERLQPIEPSTAYLAALLTKE